MMMPIMTPTPIFMIHSPLTAEPCDGQIPVLVESLLLTCTSCDRCKGRADRSIIPLEAVARAAGASEVVISTGFDNEDAQAAYRAVRYANWALVMRKRFSDR
jgi:hypothetical protein